MPARIFFKGEKREYTPEYVSVHTGVSVKTARCRIERANSGKLTEHGLMLPRARCSDDKYPDEMTPERKELLRELDDQFLSSIDKMNQYFGQAD